MRILLVEDDPMLAESMRSMLSEAPATVDWVDDGHHALRAMLEGGFDLVVLDLSLPHLDGLEVLRSARLQGVTTPVIVVTARDEIEQKLAGLDAGADDYIGKPFVMAELLARIRAVRRRSDGQAEDRLEVGPLSLDTRRHQLAFQGQSMDLQRSEFVLLHYLMRHPNQVATRRRLTEQLYGWGDGVESNALEVHIHHLRRRIGKDLIRTVRGVGYMLVAESRP